MSITSTIQRYRIYGQYGHDAEHDADDSGDYVLYEDMVNLTTPRKHVDHLVGTDRLDQLIGTGDPTPTEIHDMAVELLNWRRAYPDEPA